MSNINLAIIEDSAQLQKSLIEGFQRYPEITTIQHFGSVREFLWEKHIYPQPNVMLLDINLPKISGIEAIDPILLNYPNLNIIIFSMYSESANIMQALSKGVVGYIQKSHQSIEDIVHAIKIVQNGGSYLSPFIARKIVNLFHPSRTIKEQNSLTKREEQVLNGLAKGLTYQEIADDLVISLDTVRTYIKKLYTKLNVNNKAKLISKVQFLFNKKTN